MALALRDRHAISGVATEAELDRVLASCGVERIPDQPLAGRVKGLLVGRTLVLAAGLSGGWRCAVKAHELGHFLLHRGGGHFYLLEPSARMLQRAAEREAHVFGGALVLGSHAEDDFDARLNEAFDAGIPAAFLFSHTAALAHAYR
jgi:hypothetical protein